MSRPLTWIPENANTGATRGMLRILPSGTQEALTAYEQALALDPQFARCLEQQGQCAAWT